MRSAIEDYEVQPAGFGHVGAPLREVGEMLRSPDVIGAAEAQRIEAKAVLALLLVMTGLAATLPPVVVIVGATVWFAARTAVLLVRG